MVIIKTPKIISGSVSQEMIFIFSLICTHLADDVRDCISGFDPVTALGVDPQSHMDVREALLIWIVLRIFSESLEATGKGKTATMNRQYNANTLESHSSFLCCSILSSMWNQLVDQFYTVHVNCCCMWWHPVVERTHMNPVSLKLQVTAFLFRSGNVQNIQPCPHLVYLILVERYGSFCYFLSHLHQVFLDVLYNDVAILVRQDLTDHIAARAEESKGEESMKCLAMSDRY